jgi:hypothetical protein
MQLYGANVIQLSVLQNQPILRSILRSTDYRHHLDFEHAFFDPIIGSKQTTLVMGGKEGDQEAPKLSGEDTFAQGGPGIVLCQARMMRAREADPALFMGIGDQFKEQRKRRGTEPKL